jgi:hypothetical protein
VAAYSFLVIAIRLATEADAPALAKIAVAAYQRYVPTIGRPPAPMTADYTAVVRRGQAWAAAVDGEVVGFIILISRPGYLLLENVAVVPAADGQRGQHHAVGRCHRPVPAGGRSDYDRTDRRASASAIGPRRRPPDDHCRTGPAQWRTWVCTLAGSVPQPRFGA